MLPLPGPPDVAISHTTSRVARTIADAAAMAGALETARTPGNEAVIEAAALAVAIANGYDASAGDQISIEWKPTSGPAMNDSRAVEVIVQIPTPGLFAGLVDAQSQNISARSVARRDNFTTCVFALNETDDAAVKVSGGAVASFPCSMQVNSNHADAIIQSGTTSAIYSTEYIDVVGGYDGTNIFPTPTTGVPAADDPLASTTLPTYDCADDGYDTGNINHNSDTTYDPWFDGNGDGVLALCGRFSVNAGVTVTLQAGVYVFTDGIRINGGATLNGTAVTLYFAPLAGNDITFNGGAIIDLTAPVDGPYAGLLIFQDPNAPAVSSNLTGGSEQRLDGIVYLPTTDLGFSGGSATAESPTMLIADLIDFSGNTFLGDLENSAAASSPLLVSASFVE